MRRSVRGGIVAALALGAAAGENAALAFCRTSTCPLPADFSPSDAGCQPADFEAYCAGLDPPVVPHPVWWRNACQSYDIQQDASAQVPYDVAVTSFATAFSKWTGADCPDGGHPSISIENLGPVACDEVHYNDNTTGQGNQHVIVFRDEVWPHPDDLNNTLGLTTITFDPDTGEIYDADMEINSTVPLTVSGPVPSSGNDFLSIITHESGHFFGMAHSNDDLATMYAHYTPGSTYMRNLTSDDTAGICSIYPTASSSGGGMRAVDPAVVDGGLVPEDPCDPTPRHGFQSDCVEPPSTKKSGGCAVAATAGAEDAPGGRAAGAALLVSAAVAAAFGVRARRARR
jgi:hypothetical protein